MNALVYFLEKYVGRFGMFTLVLLALENILDDYFVCPCEDEHNHVISTFYGFVPALACLIFTIFVDLSPKAGNEEVEECFRCEVQRFLYSLLTVLTWVSLFFLDGRYLACARSDWEGVYTKSDTVQWCKPTGNGTSDFERRQRTLELMSKSQVTGFSLMIVVIIILAGFKWYSQNEPHDGELEQGQTAE